MFVYIIKQNPDFVKSPTGDAYQYDIDTNSRDQICINVNRLLQKIPQLLVGSWGIAYKLGLEIISHFP